MLLDRPAFEGRLAQRPPAEKLAVGASGLLLVLVLPPWPWALLGLLAALTAALAWARIRPRFFFGWLLLPLGFLASGALGLAVSLDSAFPWLSISKVGLRQAGEVSLRALAASTWLLWLAFTTPVTHLAALLGRIPGFDILAEVMLLVYRQMLLLIETALAMQAAQAARLGYRDMRHSLMSLGRLGAALLPRALARAQRMEIGQNARGLDGQMLACLDLPKAAPGFLLGTGLLDALILLWGWP